MENNYWEKKNENRQKAIEWNNYIEKKYSDYIKRSINRSTIYWENSVLPKPNGNPEQKIELMITDSVTALATASEQYEFAKSFCVLNFASYKNPGGKFIEGSSAQEECLCHQSTLYPVLKSFQKMYYDRNLEKKNRGLYLNRAIFIPSILFEYDHDTYFSSVLTCAAPNLTAATRNGVSGNLNTMVLKDRIKFCLDIMDDQCIDIPILGAYGCGVFGQNPVEVATIFKDLLPNYRFEKVIFAVIPGSNAEAFKKVLEG